MAEKIQTGLGIAAAVISIIYNLPLVYRVVKRGSARDVDLYFLLLRVVGVCLLMAYGVVIDDIYVIVSNLVPLFASCIILAVKTKQHNTQVTWANVSNLLTKYIRKYNLSISTPHWSDLKHILERDVHVLVDDHINQHDGYQKYQQTAVI